MPPKAYRWVAEMEEIGHFLGDDTPGGDMYEAIARLYVDIAAAAREPGAAASPVTQLLGFLHAGGHPGAQAGVASRTRTGCRHSGAQRHCADAGISMNGGAASPARPPRCRDRARACVPQ